MTATEPIADLAHTAAEPGQELLQRLAHDAERAGLVDVAYRTLDSPIGGLLVAATPEGVVRVAFEMEGYDDVLADLAGRISPRVLRAPARLDHAARELDEYFAGGRREFGVTLDMRLSAGFRARVLGELLRIPHGATATYSQVAAAAGNPRAVRAAGTACATNPLPLLVPCHRVVRSDGTIGRYLAGPEAKRALLDLEAA